MTDTAAAIRYSPHPPSMVTLHRITLREPFTLYFAQSVTPTWAGIWDACERAYTPNDGSQSRKVRHVVVSAVQYAALMRDAQDGEWLGNTSVTEDGVIVSVPESGPALTCSYGVVEVRVNHGATNDWQEAPIEAAT